MADMKSRHAAAQQVVGAVAETQAAPSAYVEFNGAFSEIRDPLRVGENDDFHEMVQQRHDAMVEGKGEDLARDVILRDQAHAALAKAAPFARINPSSSIQAVLASNATVTPPAVGTLLQSIISGAPQVAAWYGEDDSETLPVTVTFGPVGLPPFKVGIKSLRPFGIVQFGTRTTMNQFEVDIGVGCQFTISGSQVLVSVALDIPASGTVASSLTLSGMISFYAAQRSFPLTRTRYIDQLATQHNSGGIIVPPFARRMTVFVNSGFSVSSTPGSDNSTLVNLINSSGGSTASVDIPASTPYQVIEMDRQTYQVNVTNNSAQFAISYALVFDLAL